MAAGRTIGVLALRAWGHRPLTSVSKERRSHSAFDHPPTSPDTPGRQNPGIWLKDFWLACRGGGVDDDYFIIQCLPICVGEHVRAWLEFLLPDNIRDWANLKRVFVGNFQGTYVRPRTSRAASRSLMSPCGITSVGSQSSATPFLMSSTRTSSVKGP